MDASICPPGLVFFLLPFFFFSFFFLFLFLLFLFLFLFLLFLFFLLFWMDGPTEGRTDVQTNGRRDGRTQPLIAMRSRV